MKSAIVESRQVREEGSKYPNKGSLEFSLLFVSHQTKRGRKNIKSEIKLFPEKTNKVFLTI